VRPIRSRNLSLVLALGVLCGVAAPASAQVFLASRPHPEFTVGPVIVLAMVPQDLGTVQVNLSWSLGVPAGRPRPPHGTRAR
jgi:hypothetical protein